MESPGHYALNVDASGERRTNLPEGRLALLFTDIAGSTALLHRLGDDYGDLLDAHDVLLRGIWHEFGGIEVDNEGDAFTRSHPQGTRVSEVVRVGTRASLARRVDVEDGRIV